MLSCIAKVPALNFGRDIDPSNYVVSKFFLCLTLIPTCYNKHSTTDSFHILCNSLFRNQHNIQSHVSILCDAITQTVHRCLAFGKHTSHTIRHTHTDTGSDSYERMTTSSQIPLPIQHTQKTNFYILNRIRNRDPSK